MKRFFLEILVFLFVLLIPFAAFFGYIQSIPPQFVPTLMGTLHYKYDLLQQAESPRIILAGGSSSAFGVNCELLSELTGYTCISLGSVYGLGLEMYANLLEGNVREGDIVLFAPEYGMWEHRLGYALVWYACETDPDLYRAVPSSYWINMFSGNFFSYAKEKIARFNSAPSGGEPYPFLGPLGDMVNERGNIMPDGYLIEDPVTIHPDVLDPFCIEEMNALYQTCKDAGAVLLVTYPPVVNSAVISSAEDRDLFARTLDEALTPPVLGDIEDSLMDQSLFFDTNFHLNSEGARQRTYLLSDLLTPYLDPTI